MAEFITQNKIIIYAILGGLLPAVLWLWFWLRAEDKNRKEPRGLIFLTFILGALSVVVAIGLEKFSGNLIQDKNIKIIVWASIEEIVKFLAVSVVIYRSSLISKPIDYPMFFIACALGFAALENILFLIHPIEVQGTIVGALTGNLRFLGSTLLHSIASGMIGSALGLSFYREWINKKTYLFFGILLQLPCIHFLISL